MRALRALWARIEEASGLTPKPIRLHAETAWRMTTRRDPWVNLLRATGRDLLGGRRRGGFARRHAFQRRRWGCPTAFARRVARNTQLGLLVHE